MKILQTEKCGVVCIKMSSSPNGLLTSEDENKIWETLQADKDGILFDLGALEYLRSTVLRIILSVVKEVTRKNGKVVLCNPNKYVAEIFNVSGCGIKLPIADSVESGVKALL